MNGTPESWRPVVGLEDRYLISNRGRVKSLVSRLILSDKNLAGRGYVRYTLGNGAGRVRYVYAHTLVLEAFVGPCPPGLECRHKDGNELNNFLGNLSWGTRSENTRDQLIHGTHSFANKSRCPLDHEYIEANLVKGDLPNRRCLACKRARHWVRRHPEVDFREEADRRYGIIRDKSSVHS